MCLTILMLITTENSQEKSLRTNQFYQSKQNTYHDFSAFFLTRENTREQWAQKQRKRILINFGMKAFMLQFHIITPVFVRCLIIPTHALKSES